MPVPSGCDYARMSGGVQVFIPHAATAEDLRKAAESLLALSEVRLQISDAHKGEAPH
jgi:hypothetical protein